MGSVKFDNVELLNTTYTLRRVNHENAPEKIIDKINLAREDGAVFVTERYNSKIIRLEGILNGSSQIDLEGKIDDFKELFSRSEKNLDVSWNGNTRRYVASVINHDFDRDYFNLLYVPWVAEFEVLSGEGKNITPSNALTDDILAYEPQDVNFNLVGSKPAKPTITITPKSPFSSPSNSKGIEIRNNTTLERVIFIYLSGFSVGIDTIFDFENKTVKYLSVDRDFYGSFSRFKIGGNQIRVTMGGLINQETPLIAGGGGSYNALQNTNQRQAQSFQVPRTDATFQGIKLSLKKVGSPGTLTVDLVNDNNGKPTGSTVKTFTFPAGTIGTSYAYIESISSSIFTLEANKVYWLVARAASVDGSNYYQWEKSVTDIYPKGSSSSSSDSGATWTVPSVFDLMFQILFGGKRETAGEITIKVDYYKTYL